MRPPAQLIKQGITALPCIGDGRQSGTSGSPSILNAAPEAAAGGALAIVETGDNIRIDLNKRTVTLMVDDAEIDQRFIALKKSGGFPIPASQTPWQQIYRDTVEQFDKGMTLRTATRFRRVARNLPRNNH